MNRTNMPMQMKGRMKKKMMSGGGKTKGASAGGKKPSMTLAQLREAAKRFNKKLVSV